MKKTKAHVIIILFRFFSLLLLSSPQLAAVVDGAGPPAGPAPATGAGPPAPALQMRLLMLTLAKAFANKLAALMRALILSSVTVTSSLCRMRAE